MKDLTNGLFKVPSAEERRIARAGAPVNPFKLAAMLTPLQGLLFFSGWLAWTVDATDFFAVSLASPQLVTYFQKSATDVSTAITLTLLFRPLGAVIFGLLVDRYGRKWPLIANLVIIAALTFATTGVRTFGEFLAVRSLFGIGMGGIWGASAALALENMPAAPRGLFSGILQQGYAVGYLMSAAVNLTQASVDKKADWKILFYFAGAFSIFAALVRLVLPESELFRRVQEERRANGAASTGTKKTKTFISEVGHMIKSHLGRIVFGILLMTGFNFLSHSSQDLYPTIISKVKLVASPDAATLASKATIIGNCGAIAGGFVAGYLSQYLGRRLTIVLFVILTGAVIPAWILPNTFSGLAAGAFFVQFGVQGAWGVVPIYLSEISPPAFRATYAGVAYQLGNMISAASAQIEARGGESLQIANPNPKTRAATPYIPDYATVSGILLGVVCAYLILVVIFGPEYRGAEFEKAAPATVEGAGHVDGREFTGAAEKYQQGSDDLEHSAEHLGDVRLADEKNSDSGSFRQKQ